MISGLKVRKFPKKRGGQQACFRDTVSRLKNNSPADGRGVKPSSAWSSPPSLPFPVFSCQNNTLPPPSIFSFFRSLCGGGKEEGGRPASSCGLRIFGRRLFQLVMELREEIPRTSLREDICQRRNTTLELIAPVRYALLCAISGIIVLVSWRI